jgi:hypothetical protein
MQLEDTEMKKTVSMQRTGPLLVGEFRGGKAEVAKRFDRNDRTHLRSNSECISSISKCWRTERR